ncbi:MAG: hypothetical protein IKB16_03860 [Lentisphaeria bacterium]|nr:hypothetical protein [Lentisphaeria bacterium]
MNFRLILCLWIMLSCTSIIHAAQPVWILNAINNIRRASIAAKNANKIGKLATLGKCANALPDDEINRLAKITTKSDGLKELNKILGKANYIGKYGDEAGHVILQDTYLRIAIKNGHLSSKTASDVLTHLGGTPGLTSLLSKINSSNLSMAKGHLRELEIALSARKRGYTIISLGQKFADGLKKGDTDLDVFIRGKKINFAIESKAYSGLVPDAMIKADAESLAVFCKEVKNTIPVFCFEKPPSRLSQYFLSQKGVKCIFGTPDEIIAKLDVINSIK